MYRGVTYSSDTSGEQAVGDGALGGQLWLQWWRELAFRSELRGADWQVDCLSEEMDEAHRDGTDNDAEKAQGKAEGAKERLLTTPKQ